MCRKKRVCYKVTAHGMSRGEKEVPVFVRVEVCFSCPSLPAAISTLSVVPQLGCPSTAPVCERSRSQETHSQLRTDALSPPEELYSCRLCIQEKETSP